MTTSVLTRPTTTTASTAQVTQARVIRSEWTKLRSVRSTPWTLAVAVSVTVGFAALISSLAVDQWHKFSPHDRASFDAAGTPLDGLLFSVLAIGVLGVLFIGGEYGTGMIRSSLTAVPRRLPVLWGKLAVYGGVIGAVSLVMTLVSFLIGQAILGPEHHSVSITDGNALRAVLGATLYLVLAGMMAVALGTLLRNTAASISVFVAVYFVVPVLAGLLPHTWQVRINEYLPPGAGQSLYRVADNQLSFGGGLAVMVGYVVVLATAAAWRLTRRDV